MAGETLREARVAGDGNDEVVPAEAALERDIAAQILAGTEPALGRVVGIDVEDRHRERRAPAIGDDERKAAIVAELGLITRVDIEKGREPGAVALEAAIEPVGSVHGEVISTAGGGKVPAIRERLARLDRVAARRDAGDAGAHLEPRGAVAGIGEADLEGVIGEIDIA